MVAAIFKVVNERKFFLGVYQMAGGLMQLVAYGAQDVYLTGNPKVTFFQAVYKRHTNFAMEAIQQTINGTAANSQRISVTIARNGDLVGYMYAQILPADWVLGASPAALGQSPNLTSNNVTTDGCWVAERAFTAIELSIGGQRIDKHYQAWWRLYAEMFLSDENKVQYNKMSSVCNNATSASKPTNVVYLPLLFFFNRNPGLYLPLIALQYHEVRLDIDCSINYANWFGTNQPIIWANYVFLDTEERRRFAKNGHEYLIEQVQHTGGDSLTAGESSPATIRLSFNHPVKELIFAYQNSGYAGISQPNALWNFSSNCANVQVTTDLALLTSSNSFIRTTETGSPQIVLLAGTVKSGSTTLSGAGSQTQGLVEDGAAGPNLEVGPLYQFKLILNGQDRFKEQYGKYFNQVQPWYHHTGNPYPGIYSYSFALHPEEHQPTGTCNFSRIDNAQVQVWLKSPGGSTANTDATKIQKLFAVNYNILRIQSGMGGLAFSN